MAKAKEYSTYPFPYFKVKVTRIESDIQKKVDEKYQEAKKFEGRPQDEHLWREFCDAAAKITNKGRGESEYIVDLKKVEKIIEKCRPKIEADVQNYAAPHNQLHPQQVQMMISNAGDNWYMADDVSTVLIDEAIRKFGIALDINKSTYSQAQVQGVADLKAVPLSEGAKLEWTLPNEAEGVQISRGRPGEKPKVLETKLSSDQVQFRDQNLVAGQTYEYHVGTYFSGKVSNFKTVEVTPFGSLPHFKAEERDSCVSLKWRNPKEFQEMLLLKSRTALPAVRDEQGRLNALGSGVKTIPLGTESAFIDTDVERGGTYFYVLVARYATGVVSVSPERSLTLDGGLPEPQDLEATPHPHSINVKWRPVSTPNRSYRLVRSETPNPKDPNANAKSWTVSYESLEDKTYEPGTTYWYLVRTEAGGKRSDWSAPSKPILALGEVRNLTTEPGSHSVGLSWETPPKAKRVEVRRCQGSTPQPPKKSREQAPGVLVRSFTDESQFQDQELQNDVNYFYRVSCVYQTQTGEEVITRGDVCEAIPSVPPVAVSDICLARGNLGIEIRWDSNPPVGSVEVIRSAQSLQSKPGKIHSRNAVLKLGELFTPTGGCRVVDHDPSAATPFYYVYSVKGGQSLLCKILYYSEVSEVTPHLTGQVIGLKWDWPPRSSEMEIECVATGDTQNVLYQDRVTRVSGNGMQGTCSFQVPADGEYRVRLKSRSQDPPKKTLCGPGKSLNLRVGHSGVVTWRLKKPLLGKVFRKQSTLEIQSSGTLHGVQSFVLIGKESELPDSPVDGVQLAQVKIGDPNQTSYVTQVLNPRTVLKHRSVGEVFCRLFAEPAESVYIDPPPFDDRVM